jgi:hypothetical protein
VRAYDLDSGKEKCTADFSKYGFGGDEAGLCLMGGKLFYSCLFGRKPTLGKRPGRPSVSRVLPPAN